MLLIRGVGSEAHAKPINNGLIGFRDVASVLSRESNVTCYSKSNYHERLFAQTRLSMSRFTNIEIITAPEWRKLVQYLMDEFIAGTHMTFFHIVESEASFEWLENNFDDSAHFIYYEPRIEVQECVLGNHYFGQRMQYVNNPEEIDVRATMISNPALAAIMSGEIHPNTPVDQKAWYSMSFLTSIVPLFNRIREGQFNELENEFRMIFRTPRLYFNGITQTQLRDDHWRIRCNNEEYKMSVLEKPDYKIHRVELELVFTNISSGKQYDIWTLMRKEPHPAIQSYFEPVDIRDTAVRYGYIGDKTACRQFIENELCGRNTRIIEDENNHQHTGEWRNQFVRKIHHVSETGMILRPPDDNVYHWD